MFDAILFDPILAFLGPKPTPRTAHFGLQSASFHPRKAPPACSRRTNCRYDGHVVLLHFSRSERTAPSSATFISGRFHTGSRPPFPVRRGLGGITQKPFSWRSCHACRIAKEASSNGLLEKSKTNEKMPPNGNEEGLVAASDRRYFITPRFPAGYRLQGSGPNGTNGRSSQGRPLLLRTIPTRLYPCTQRFLLIQGFLPHQRATGGPSPSAHSFVIVEKLSGRPSSSLT